MNTYQAELDKFSLFLEGINEKYGLYFEIDSGGTSVVGGKCFLHSMALPLKGNKKTFEQLRNDGYDVIRFVEPWSDDNRKVNMKGDYTPRIRSENQNAGAHFFAIRYPVIFPSGEMVKQFFEDSFSFNVNR